MRGLQATKLPLQAGSCLCAQQKLHGLLLVAVGASQRIERLLPPKSHFRYRLNLGLQANHLLLRQGKGGGREGGQQVGR